MEVVKEGYGGAWGAESCEVFHEATERKEGEVFSEVKVREGMEREEREGKDEPNLHTSTGEEHTRVPPKLLLLFEEEYISNRGILYHKPSYSSAPVHKPRTKDNKKEKS